MNRLLIGASDKTALFLHFLQQDFPHGLTLIDPDGSLAKAALDIIPVDLTEEVNYFNPSDAKNVGSFNVFANVTDKTKLVQDISSFFDAMFPAGAETLTRLNSNFVLANILTVITDTPGVTFRSVLEFLSDEEYQAACLSRCTNPMALSNWQAIQEWEPAQRKAAYAQITAKLGTLLLSPLMFRTLEGKSTFHLTKTNILIANLSRAKLGDEAAKLLGTLLITRAKTPVYINDFDFFASDYVASLFSQGGYTVSVPFLSTVPPNVAQRLLSFPEKYVFRTTPEDAERLKFGTRFTEGKNLVELKEGDFEPEIAIQPPQVTGRSRAVLKRSIARHTRRVKTTRA